MKVSFAASVRFACEGIISFLKTEKNGQRQLLFGGLAISLGLFLSLSKTEWLAVCCCITAVIAAEMFNTAIEKLCDLVTTEIRPEIKLIKDVSAGAVLVVSLGAAMAGLLIFVPHLIALL